MTGLAAIVKSLALFVLAGLAEIGGGYLVWQWLRENKGLGLGVIGGVILFFYGVIPTFQNEAAFGRVYAARWNFYRACDFVGNHIRPLATGSL